MIDVELASVVLGSAVSNSENPMYAPPGQASLAHAQRVITRRFPGEEVPASLLTHLYLDALMFSNRLDEARTINRSVWG